jgi:hypothetical protein
MRIFVDIWFGWIVTPYHRSKISLLFVSIKLNELLDESDWLINWRMKIHFVVVLQRSSSSSVIAVIGLEL